MNEKLKMLFDVYGSHIAQPDLAILVYSVCFWKIVWILSKHEIIVLLLPS